jgi:mRNA interferase RelE/StbE
LGYEVRIAPGATRAIEKLSAQVQDAVLDRLAELSTDPRPDGSRKLRGLPRGYEVYRVAVQGTYRIIYQAKDEEAWILVLKVADRKDVYKRVDDLRRLLR